MNLPELGTLDEIDLRDAWPHEAHSFTPWLAANLCQLTALIGIPLELEDTEVAVDLYSADILARNPLDDSLVLIENQLEPSDHSHLGQVMTYLAGLDASTVIWIAKEFREPHLAAIHWLNDHTDESFAFFAVRVRAVRIGNSAPAPQFEICCRPNEWQRRLQSITQGSKSESALNRTKVWNHLIQRHPAEAAFGPANGANSRWRSLNGIEFVVAIYLARNEVGVFIRGVRNADPEDVFQRLAAQRDELETLIGVSLQPHPQGRFFVSRHSADTQDSNQWDGLCDWLHEMSEKYETLLRRIFTPTT